MESAERLRRGFDKDTASPHDTPEREPRRVAVGKLTLSERWPTAVQRKAEVGDVSPEVIHASAERGVATSASALPHAERIQRLFGRHDISRVQAHTGAAAAASAQAMGAAAFATGDHVVLGDHTDLRTVAHEVAHVVQQRGGVQLLGGVGADGDVYERHADAVADLVVRGESAEALLDHHAGSGGGGAGGVQRMLLKMVGSGKFVNLDPRREQLGEKPVYDLEIPEDRRAVERHWAREQQREDDERRQREDEERDDEPALLMQDQLLLMPGQHAGQQDAAQRHGQSHVPDVTVNLSGSEFLRPLGGSILTSSKTIDLHASWTPGPTPPDGHSPAAVVGWVQNVVHMNKQADYFDADDGYVETSFKEHNRPVIDSDDPGSMWYDPPRPYQEVRSADQLRLFGGKQPSGARGIPMSDKPQDVFPLVSPKGGLLHRFGGETEFVACLVMTEPDGSRPTVLEWFTWKYEYGYTLHTTPSEQRPSGYERPTQFDTLYADTRITGRGNGMPSRTVTLKVSGAHGNAFFEQLPTSWENLAAGHDPYDDSRFPSFI